MCGHCRPGHGAAALPEAGHHPQWDCSKLLPEFFSFGSNSILYQCGIHPSQTFTQVQKYGLTLLVTTDPELTKCLNNVVEQLKIVYTSVQKY